MKVFEVQDAFGLENLRPAERPRPEPAPGEVLLRLRAVSLNYRDVLMVGGLYNPRQPLPLIPCSDGVGLVEAVGEGVNRFAVGERVCPIFAQGWLGGAPSRDLLATTLGGPLDGTLRQWMTVPAAAAVKVPEHLDDAQAASLPCAGLTAWSALVDHGAIRAGDTVLILGTGGVALFALQFARICGARAVITSSSDEKLERARELGAWRTINYRTEPEWGKRVLELTGGAGANIVVELGGAGTLAQSAVAVAVGGTISLIGNLAGNEAPFNTTRLLMKQARVQGVLVGSRDGFEAMNRAIDARRLEPVVDRVFPFEEAPRAFEHMIAGRHQGKVAVAID